MVLVKQFIIKLKILLRYNITYITIGLLVLIVSYIRINLPIKSKYNQKDTIISGVVIKVESKKIIIDAKERVLVIVSNSDLKVGDQVKIKGYFLEINEPTNFNQFDYQKYLLSKRIISQFYLTKLIDVKPSQNLLLAIKRSFNDHLSKYKSSDYLKSILIGDKSEIDTDLYSKVGVLHLFSVASMHVSLFIYMMLSVLKKYIKRSLLSYGLLISSLLVYLLIIDFPISVMRSVYFFTLNFINRTFNLKISKLQLLLVVLSIILLDNPYLLYSMGLYYSFTIAVTIMYIYKRFKNYNYFKRLIYISLIIFLVGLPLTIDSYYIVNLLSPLYNIIYIPLVLFVIYPLSIITCFLPNSNLLDIILKLVETMTILFSQINFNLIFAKAPLYITYIYYIVIFLYIKKRNNYYLLILFLMLFVHYNVHLFKVNPELHMIDVGQGDSLLFTYPKDDITFLIDTGSYGITSVNYLKALGIKRINYLVITHGDSDHIGGAIDVVNNYNVDYVLMNSGSTNELELELIKSLNLKHIKYYQINKYQLNKEIAFINTKDRKDENNDCLIMFIKINNYQLLFLGDAPKIVEEKVIKENKLENVDIIKIGHHGSATSTSNVLMNMSPKLALISVAKFNNYQHPSPIIIDKLSNITTLLTSLNGSVKIILDEKLNILVNKKEIMN